MSTIGDRGRMATGHDRPYAPLPSHGAERTMAGTAGTSGTETMADNAAPGTYPGGVNVAERKDRHTRGLSLVAPAAAPAPDPATDISSRALSPGDDTASQRAPQIELERRELAESMATPIVTLRGMSLVLAAICAVLAIGVWWELLRELP